jgi:hypothetical protein
VLALPTAGLLGPSFDAWGGPLQGIGQAVTLPRFIVLLSSQESNSLPGKFRSVTVVIVNCIMCICACDFERLFLA